MQIDFKDKLAKNLSKDIIQPRRSQIYVGFKCSQKCGFCYYKSKCNSEMFPFDYIKKQIDFEYAYGIRDFEITGGEPSECKDLIKVCEYIKNKDANSKIAVITNGGLYAINVWPFIDEVLVSYHSGKESFDKLMFPNGSTYDKVAKTIEKAQSLNKLVRINSIIATFNMNQYQSIIDDIIKFYPHIVNILPINLFDESRNLAQYINYAKVKPIIKNAINKLINVNPNILIFVRYIPFCNMEGYEKYIIGNLQHIYDWFDWNAELCGLNILRLINNDPDKQLEKLGAYGSTSISSALNEVRSLYHKSNKCLVCKYLPICDGFENNVDANRCQPIIGKQIFDIMYFMNTVTQDFYRKWYHVK